MDLSVNWIRELAPELRDESPGDLAERLTLTAVAVEKVTPVGQGLEDLVVGRVLEVEPHPDADRLTLCRVEDGSGEPQEVICGAPNVQEGGLYPLVRPGGHLPDGTEIEARAIRGVTSRGMLCSERELGLGPDHRGILLLPPDVEPGERLAPALDLPDYRLELDLTPNRVDLACHVGAARELAPAGEAGVVLPVFEGPEWSPEWDDGEEEARAADVPIRVAERGRCTRYLAAVIRDVEVGPSPAWLAARIRGAGGRPVNNVVDATNYVLRETNQPLHAFDLGRIEGPEIAVRGAETGEELRTLDGTDRALDPVQTVIADAAGPVALAGVMGGEDSEVGPQTTDVLLECALFDPGTTRAGARHAALSTDASYRFERGVDPRGLEDALSRCVELILSLAGGRAEARAARVGGPAPERRSLTLRPERVEQVLGRDFSAGRLASTLRPIGFECRETGEERGPGRLSVTVPGWRGDVTREIDLVEEVARREGFDSFPTESPSFRPSAVPEDEQWERADRVRRRLVARGLYEVRSIPFVAGDGEVEGHGVHLRNPISEEEDRLRDGLLPVLIRALDRNFSRGERSVRLFEIGSVFRASPGGPVPSEELRAGAVLTGYRDPVHWSEESRAVDVWDLKGLAAEIAEDWCGGRLVAAQDPPAGPADDGLPMESALLGPERFWMVQGGGVVGMAGRIHPDALEIPDWATPAWGLEFSLEAIGDPPRRTYREISSFPPVSRDLAVVVDRALPAGELESTIRSAAPETLESLRLFDLYEGEQVGEGRRSLAWRFTFRAPDRTLRDEEVEAAIEEIARVLTEEHDARIRTD